MTGDRSGPGGTAISLVDGRRRLGISMQALWIGYFSVGGNGSLAEVAHWLSGRESLSGMDHDMLAQALNDRFTEAGLNHPVAYTRT